MFGSRPTPSVPVPMERAERPPEQRLFVQMEQFHEQQQQKKLDAAKVFEKYNKPPEPPTPEVEAQRRAAPWAEPDRHTMGRVESLLERLSVSPAEQQQRAKERDKTRGLREELDRQKGLSRDLDLDL